MAVNDGLLPSLHQNIRQSHYSSHPTSEISSSLVGTSSLDIGFCCRLNASTQLRVDAGVKLFSQSQHTSK